MIRFRRLTAGLLVAALIARDARAGVLLLRDARLIDGTGAPLARALMHPVLGGRWHGELFAPPDLSEEFVGLMQRSGAYQVTTLSLLDTWPGHFDPAQLDDPLVRLTVPAEEIAMARDEQALRRFADGVIGFAMPWVPHVLRPLALDWVWTRANLDARIAYSQRNLRHLYEAGDEGLHRRDAGLGNRTPIRV